jgi:hypothetical protein
MTMLTMDGIGTLGLVIPMLMFLVAGAIESLNAVRARLLFRPAASLQPGDIVVRGKVEYALGAGGAVRVEIDQMGREISNSASWSQLWTEVGRRVRMVPFYLRLPSGERIRVEPSGDVLLIDRLEGLVRHDLTSRTRVAELTPGEEVFVRGRLEQGPDPELPQQGAYRNRSTGLILRAPRGQRTMTISSEPPQEPFFSRAKSHGKAVLGLLLLSLVAHAGAAPFHLLRWCGTTVQARVTSVEYKSVEYSESWRQYYRVTLALPGKYGTAVHDVDHDEGAKLSAGTVVPAVVVPFWPTINTIGARVTARTYYLLAWVIVPILWLMSWVMYRSKPRHWYERALIDNEPGRLGDPPKQG